MNPYNECACFVGNLLDGDDSWGLCRIGKVFRGEGKVSKNVIFKYGYTTKEIVALENCFMENIWKGIYQHYTPKQDLTPVFENLPNKEDILFEAFEKTLELLKSIHIEKGEIIEECPTFIKRELVFS